MNVRARLTVIALAYAVLSLATTEAAGAQLGSLAFGSCAPTQVSIATRGLQCAVLPVPFDRSDPAVGSIALAVQRVPASAPRTGTIVLLAGGPGQPALPAFEAFLGPLAHEPALRGFELVAFDQRGTGQSEGVQCPETSLSPISALLKGGVAQYLGECGTALGPTRAFYTSQESVEDLDALRQALGGTPLSLFAVSYGGRVAGMYAREHPQGVARMVLDSPTPVTGPDILQTSRLHALRRVLDEGICGAGACRSFSADLFADLTRLVATLHSRPMHTKIYDARGDLRPASVTEARVLSLVSGLDLSKGTRELAPAAIAAAAHGNAAPLARLTSSLAIQSTGSNVARATEPATPLPPRPVEGEPSKAEAPPSDSAISLPLLAATYCDETELPWSPDSPTGGRSAALRGWLATQPAQAFAPFAPSSVAAASAARNVCIDWPTTPPAPRPPTGVSAVPTLLLAGVDDLRTPYEQARVVAAAYSDGQLLKVPGVGHSTVTTDSTGCAKRAMIEFLSAGTTPGSCASSGEPQAVPLPPSSLDLLPAAASRSRVAGQVASAVAMTIEDVFGQTSFSGGGLRGGGWAEQSTGFVLHDMVDVPGVALSGTVHVRTILSSLPSISGHLTVHGRLAGTLTLQGFVLSGRVAGAPVHARLAAL